MKMKNLSLVLLLVFTLLTNGLSIPVYAAEQQKQGTVTVLGNDGEPLVSETAVQLDQNETATAALLKAVGEDNVAFDEYSFGRMISSINGLKGDETHYWGFFVNGISSPIGSDDYIVQSGDQLTFRYTDSTKPIQSVSLSVLNGEENMAPSWPIEIFGEANAFQLLQVVMGPDKVVFDTYDWGKMITSINGIVADDHHFWGFYVNGKMAPVGADSYSLKPGDEISFKLDSMEPLPGGGDNDQTNPEPPAGGTVSKEVLQKAIDSVSGKILASDIGEWEAVALSQAGKAIPAGYLDSVGKIVIEKQGKFRNITDTERYVLGIVAAGGDPSNIEGYDLIEAIYNGNVTRQGLIGVAFALVALDSGDFSVPDTAQWTREKLVNHLLEKQNADGGWNWDGVSASDVDSTAIIITALAQYKDQPEVKNKVEKAVQYLAAEYQASKIDNSNTAAQMIIALSALGMDANAAQFAKDESSLFQYFLSFQTSDGGFAWQPGEKDSNGYATQQSFLALVAYQLFSEGKGSLYQMGLAEQTPDPNQPGTETPGTEIPNTDEPNIEKPVVQTPVTKDATNKKAGSKLPDTAAGMYNFIALGLLFILIGSVFFIKQRKGKA